METTPEEHNPETLLSVFKESKQAKPAKSLKTKDGLSAPGYTGDQIEREIKKDPNFYKNVTQGPLSNDIPISSAIKLRVFPKNNSAVQMPIFPDDDEFGGGKSKRTTKRIRKNNKRKTRRHKKTNKKHKKAKKQTKRRK